MGFLQRQNGDLTVVWKIQNESAVGRCDSSSLDLSGTWKDVCGKMSVGIMVHLQNWVTRGPGRLDFRLQTYMMVTRRVRVNVFSSFARSGLLQPIAPFNDSYLAAHRRKLSEVGNELMGILISSGGYSTIVLKRERLGFLLHCYRDLNGKIEGDKMFIKNGLRLVGVQSKMYSIRPVDGKAPFWSLDASLKDYMSALGCEFVCNQFITKVEAGRKLLLHAGCNLFLWAVTEEELAHGSKFLKSWVQFVRWELVEENDFVPKLYWAGIPGNATDLPFERTFEILPDLLKSFIF